MPVSDKFLKNGEITLINVMTFVNGSNLFGTFKHLEVFVDDYEALYRYIFTQAVEHWRSTVIAATPPVMRQVRVYWYVVDSMDEWDLNSMRSRQHLHERFIEDREVRTRWIAEATRAHAARGLDAAKIDQASFTMCFDDFRQWYEKKQTILSGMNRFYHAVESSSDFIEIRRCGRWKVDLLHKNINEKGLDAGFATDMVAFQQNYNVAVLIGVDSDGIAGLGYIKDAGKQVMVVEFQRGSHPEGRIKPTTTRLKLTADCVVPIYEADLIRLGLATKAEGDDLVERDAENNTNA